MAEHLSPLEAIMWRVGQDPTLRMTLGAVVILDRPPALPDLLERVWPTPPSTRPRLRCRPDDPTALRLRPEWVEDDPGFDDAHVRRLSVAAPGSTRQLLDLVALLEVIPFDPERSPWDVTVIEGLEGGRAALYLRAHHVVTDGVGGIRLLGLLLDEPTWPRVVPPTAAEASDSAIGTRPTRTGPSVDGDRPSVSSPSRSTCRGRCGGSSTSPRSTIDTARDVDPLDTAVRGVQTCARCRQLGVPAADGRRRTARRATGSAIAAQPLRGDLGRRGARRRPRPRRQPQ